MLITVYQLYEMIATNNFAKPIDLLVLIFVGILKVIFYNVIP